MMHYGNDENSAMALGAPTAKKLSHPKNNSTTSSAGLKTPSSRASSTTRRALGDISNKKQQQPHPVQLQTNGVWKDGFGISPTGRTFTGAEYNSAKSLSQTKSSNNLSQKQPFSSVDKKNTKNLSNNNNIKRTTKQVNFLAEKIPAPLDLTGLDPIEMPAGRLYSEWGEEEPLLVPERMDLQKIILDRRLQAQIEQQARIEREGEALLEKQMKQVLLQDELDVQQFHKDVKVFEDDSFDLALEAYSDYNFLNVSF